MKTGEATRPKNYMASDFDDLLDTDFRSESRGQLEIKEQQPVAQGVKIIRYERTQAFLDSIVGCMKDQRSFWVSFHKDLSPDEKWKDVVSLLKLFNVEKTTLRAIILKANLSVLRSIDKYSQLNKDTILSNLKNIDIIPLGEEDLSDVASSRLTLGASSCGVFSFQCAHWNMFQCVCFFYGTSYTDIVVRHIFCFAFSVFC